jgi:hypothetical protein
MSDFTSEDDLNNFDRYLRYQGIDQKTTEPDVMHQFTDEFDRAIAKRSEPPNVR